MKRIIFVSPTLQPDAGGIQVSGRIALNCLVKYSNKHSLQIDHFAYGEDERLGSIPSDHVTYHPTVSRFQAIRKAVHLRSSDSIFVFWHLGLLKLLPLIVGSRSSVNLCLFGLEAWNHFSGITGRLLKKVDRFLSISSYTWRRFLQKNPRLKSQEHRIVHLGIAEPPRESISFPDDPPAALMLGRLSREPDYSKGHTAMIRAWPLVRRDYPNAELWIAGKGARREELESLVGQLGLEDYVHFLGWVSDERKEELIKRSRFMALPSRGEGFGFVYLEAMRLGRPCLVSTLDAGREVVNPPEAGLAADPSDTAAIAEASRRLLENGASWKAWSQRCRRRYENNFTESKFCQRLTDSLSV